MKIRLFKDIKIFRTVVCSDFIDVVDGLRRFQVSTNVFFCDKSMLKNIPLLVAKWMVRLVNTNITKIIDVSSTFPTRCFAAPELTQFSYCFLGMSFTFISITNFCSMFFRKFSIFSPWDMPFCIASLVRMRLNIFLTSLTHPFASFFRMLKTFKSKTQVFSMLFGELGSFYCRHVDIVIGNRLFVNLI